MQPCPFCHEDLREGAVKCRYCQSLLLPGIGEQSTGGAASQDDQRQVTLILDRGFVYFGKFVAAVIAIIIAVGAILYGVDVKGMREQVSKDVAEISKTRGQVTQILGGGELGKADSVPNLNDDIKGIRSDLKDFATRSELVALQKRLTAVEEVLQRKLDGLSAEAPTSAAKPIGRPGFPRETEKFLALGQPSWRS